MRKSPQLDSLTQQLRAAVQPPIKKVQFRVFVFGPYLKPDDIVQRPRIRGSSVSHEKLNQHARYLRFATRRALMQEGFSVDFGETTAVNAFWNDAFGSPDPASNEFWHALKACGAVVVFPSSVGAICELSIFANFREISQKTVAIIHKDFENEQSFFRLGLIEWFRREKGDRVFHDYFDHERCINEAVRFVKSEYTTRLIRHQARENLERAPSEAMFEYDN